MVPILLLLAGIHNKSNPGHQFDISNITHHEHFGKYKKNHKVHLIHNETTHHNVSISKDLDQVIHHNTTLRPHSDIVVITINRNWTEVCHHIKFYMTEFCSSLVSDPLDECEGVPLAIGDLLCFHGICICLGHRRQLHRTTHHQLITDVTTVTAEVRHGTDLSNMTAWPSWVQSVVLIETPPDPPYEFLVASAVGALIGLCLVGCAVRAYHRYMGYKIIEPAKGVDPGTS